MPQGTWAHGAVLVTKGRVSVHVRHAEGAIRLVIFASGSVFGELAILDRGPRSATVTADQDVTAFALRVKLSMRCGTEPAVAIKLLAALGCELSVRLRSANLTIQQLEL